MHLDLGEEYSDHHVFFMQRAEPHVKKTFVHHTSYEVADMDTQLIGRVPSRFLGAIYSARSTRVALRAEIRRITSSPSRYVWATTRTSIET